MVSTVGNKCVRNDSRDPGDCPSRDSSKPDSNHRVFQLQIQESMEGDISINGEECEGRMAAILRPDLGRGVEPVVMLPGGCTIANGGMQADGGVFASDISRPCAMQCEAKGGFEADRMELKGRGEIEGPQC